MIVPVPTPQPVSALLQRCGFQQIGSSAWYEREGHYVAEYQGRCFPLMRLTPGLNFSKSGAELAVLTAGEIQFWISNLVNECKSTDGGFYAARLCNCELNPENLREILVSEIQACGFAVRLAGAREGRSIECLIGTTDEAITIASYGSALWCKRSAWTGMSLQESFIHYGVIPIVDSGRRIWQWECVRHGASPRTLHFLLTPDCSAIQEILYPAADLNTTFEDREFTKARCETWTPRSPQLLGELRSGMVIEDFVDGRSAKLLLSSDHGLINIDAVPPETLQRLR